MVRSVVNPASGRGALKASNPNYSPSLTDSLQQRGKREARAGRVMLATTLFLSPAAEHFWPAKFA
jgi:hypothetical protein